MKRTADFSSFNQPSYPTEEMKDLFGAILSLKNPHEAEMFFRDLCTMPELVEFSNRWQTVILLLEGKSYLEIANKLGVSTATVTRVAHWLYEGQGGYKLAATRLHLLPKQKEK